MEITFYGVRGSIPTPGPETIKYGGNTTSILVEDQVGNFLILDAGTGIRKLGIDIQGVKEEIYILLSHNHWDHIQGFPYFIPAYSEDSQITITPGDTDLDHPNAILDQMKGSFFPLSEYELSANIKITPQTKNDWDYKSFKIKRCKMNHPGGGSAYRICSDNKSLVYATDNELFPPYPVQTKFEEWVEFAKDVDYLIHDGQYLPDDYPFKRGWGHSQVQHALDLALQANVKNLILVSHDPDRTDEEIDNLKEELHLLDYPFKIIFAHEGLILK
ncbi:MBL fold metallo-hydrolase [Pseudoalteromonas phenolica]|uniref:MBL fold metallo-hydrolase n=1 Tax=Pseudoalteromonas phenolica TaxID=161398 RepID=UPI00110BFD8E|nr:MBL fold metallo-hydrolase [Pseudoalteromonas phenolica]TMN86668.1 MBL fold metallo-hydrolase [Pseudoalteromonas phenolica]